MFAAGVYTFAENADFAPGGITGISLLLNHVFGIPVGTLTLFINLPLIVISYRTLGKRFLLKTAKSMVITTFFLDVVFPVFPMYEGQRMMAALCSGALMGAGMVMFYMRGSSSGGLDFVIMPIKKKRPHLSVGKITMIIDLGIILLGWPVFGDVDAALYGLVSTFASVVVIDKVLYGLGAGTLAFVVTEKGDEVAAKIAVRYPRGEAYEGMKQFRSPICYGKSELLYEEEKIVIIFVGHMAELADQVRKGLKEKGYCCSLVNARFVKPLDTELLERLAENHDLYVTIEENMLTGGFGEQVLDYISGAGINVRVKNFGIADDYVEHGNVDLLRREVGLDKDTIVKQIIDEYV